MKLHLRCFIIFFGSKTASSFFQHRSACHSKDLPPRAMRYWVRLLESFTTARFLNARFQARGVRWCRPWCDDGQGTMDAGLELGTVGLSQLFLRRICFSSISLKLSLSRWEQCRTRLSCFQRQRVWDRTVEFRRNFIPSHLFPPQGH